MTTTLSAIRESADVARTDLLDALKVLRLHVLAVRNTPMREAFARVAGNVHELELLRKRELAIIAHGRMPDDECRMTNDECQKEGA